MSVSIMHGGTRREGILVGTLPVFRLLLLGSALSLVACLREAPSMGCLCFGLCFGLWLPLLWCWSLAPSCAVLIECLCTVWRGGLLDEPGTLLHLCFADPCSGLGDNVPSLILVFSATGSIFQVKLVRLVGIMLLLYVKADLALNISEVEIETVGTGIMGRMVRMTTVREKG